MRVRDEFRLAAPLARARDLVVGELGRHHYRLKENRPSPDRLLISARKRTLGLFGATSSIWASWSSSPAASSAACPGSAPA